MSVSPDSLSATQRLQYRFTAHLRDPQNNPAPEGLEERRIKIYRELIYNNIEDLLGSNFPVIRKLLDGRPWHALVRGFLIEHKARTPLFPELGREMLRYLEARAERGAGDAPFLVELAHYEWLEVSAMLDRAEIADLPHDPAGDLLQGQPLVSPLARPVAYRYPVQHIRPEFQPSEPPATPTCLIIVRNRADLVSFMESNPLTLRLIEILQGDESCGGRDALLRIASEIGAADAEAVVRAGAEILEKLRGRDVILGTRLSAPARS